MSLINKLKHLLSLRVTSIVILLFSISGRVTQKLASFGLDTDKCFQVQATKNLLTGHGISIHEVVDSNLSISHYTPLIKWPPGFSLLLSPFHAISGSHDLWGTLWLDLLACILFVLLARKLILALETPIWLVNVFTLLRGFYLYDFLTSDSSDGITLVFFLGALLLTLKFLRSSNKNITTATGIVLLLFSCCMLRYMYFPVAMVIPLYVLLIGIIEKNKLLIRRGVFMLALIVILIAALLIYNKIVGGAATYLYPMEKGFFPGNLLQTVPFLYSSIGNFGPPAIYLKDLFGIQESTMLRFFISTHMAVMIVLFLIALKWMIRKKFRASGTWEHFTYLVLFVSLAIVATLFYLSLTNKSLPLGYGLFWTYVSESRYFAAPVFLVQVWFVVFVYRLLITSRLRKKFGIFLLLPLFLSLLHAFYFTGKKIMGGNNNFFHRAELVTLDSCRQILQRFVTDHPDHEIISASTEPMFNNFAKLWENIPGLYNYQLLNTSEFRVDKPTILFVSIHERQLADLHPFLAGPHEKFIGQTGPWQFYSLEVLPLSDKR